MNNPDMKYSSNERGIALLITLLTITVLLGISASLLNVTLKQYQFASIGLASEMAFQAANAGMECLLYHDNDAATFPLSRFDVRDDDVGVSPETGVTCMEESSDDLVAGNGAGPLPSAITPHANLVDSGEEQRFRFSWTTGATGATELCTDVSIYKFSSDTAAQDMEPVLGRPATCAAGVVCTVVRSRGYNVACPAPGENFPARTVERELVQRY